MRKSILIVDDEFGLADLIAELLMERGYDVTIAINGKRGLEQLAARRPDLVLLDVMMPILDGPAMLHAMRANPAYAAIPVIMMTAHLEALPSDAPPRYQAALLKPFTPERLLGLIGQLLRETA